MLRSIGKDKSTLNFDVKHFENYSFSNRTYVTFHRKRSTFQNVLTSKFQVHFVPETLASNVLKSIPFPMEYHIYPFLSYMFFSDLEL